MGNNTAGKLVFVMLMAAVAGCTEEKKFITVTNPSTGLEESLSLQLSKPSDSVEIPAGGFPGLVFVHGGGWNTGGRLDYDKEIQKASEMGYVAISVDYRLTTQDAQGKTIYPWPAQIQDVTCAIRWLRSKAADYHLNPDRIGIMGESSGGQIALMIVEQPNNPAFESPACTHQASSDVQVAVSLLGVADIETVWEGSEALHDDILALVDSDASVSTTYANLDAETRSRIESADPLGAVGASDVPVLIVHPTDDWFVPPGNSLRYYNKLIDLNRTAYFIQPTTGQHFFGTDGQLARDYAKTKMYQWFDAHLRENVTALPCDPATQCEISLH